MEIITKLIQWFQGWKTYGAGVLAILTGAVMVLTGAAGLVAHYAVPDSPYVLEPKAAMEMISTGMLTISAGLAALGIGHKMERMITATKEVKREVKDVEVAVGQVEAAVDDNTSKK